MNVREGRGVSGSSWTLAIWVVAVGLGAGAIGSTLATRRAAESEQSARVDAWRAQLVPLRARLDALERHSEGQGKRADGELRDAERLEEAIVRLEQRVDELESLVHEIALGRAPERRGGADVSESASGAAVAPSPYGQAAGTVTPTGSATEGEIPEVVLAAARRAVIEEQRRAEQERESGNC